jgi:hypothetical protein
LDFRNAQPASLGSDFGRLGIIKFWDKVIALDPENANRKQLLDYLNQWRNAIAHQHFDPAKLGGTARLRLGQVSRWRRACHALAKAFDEVARQHVSLVSGTSPC